MICTVDWTTARLVILIMLIMNVLCIFYCVMHVCLCGLGCFCFYYVNDTFFSHNYKWRSRHSQRTAFFLHFCTEVVHVYICKFNIICKIFTSPLLQEQLHVCINIVFMPSSDVKLSLQILSSFYLCITPMTSADSENATDDSP